MAKKLITGLVIRDDALEWTTLHKVMDRLEPTGSGRLELRSDADVAGGGLGTDLSDEVPSTEGLGTKAEALAKAADLKGNVTVGLPSAQLLLRVVSLPAVDKDELGSMVQLQVDKFSPFPVESIVVSYEVLTPLSASVPRPSVLGTTGDKSTQPGTDKGNTCLVLIAAVKKEVIDTLGKTFEMAGIYPTRMDASVLGWWRLLSDTGEIATTERQVVLLMNGTGAEIIVFQDGVPIVFRWLEKGEGLTEDKFADEMAREIGYTLMSLELEYGGGIPCSITVWSRTSGETPDTLVEKLHEEYSCEVAVKSLESLPSVSEGLARRTAARDGAKLDLIPVEWQVTRKARLFKKRMFIAVGVLFGAWALGAVSFMGGLYYQEHKLTSLKVKQTEMQKPAMEVRDMRRRVFMIKRYIDRTYSALECLREISMLQPTGIDLTSFSYRKGEGIKISGEAENVNLVYGFKNKLDGTTLWGETTLHGPQRDSGKKKEIFDIELKLPGGEQ